MTTELHTYMHNNTWALLLATSTMCVIFHLQKGITPFRCAVDMERSKIVKYFVEEIKVDTTLYDQVTTKVLYTYVSKPLIPL